MESRPASIFPDNPIHATQARYSERPVHSRLRLIEIWGCTGYYSSWAQGGGQAQYTIGGKPFTPDLITWKAYTHIVHFGVTPNNDGTINEGGRGLSATMMKDFVAAAHAHNVKAIICIGGGGTGNQYAAAASNLTVRTKPFIAK